jgi:hypothetical protein
MSLSHALGLGKHVFWVMQRDACGNPSQSCRGSPVRLTRVADQSTKQWTHISPLHSAKFAITLVASPHTLLFLRRRLVLRSPLRSSSSRLPTLASLPS